MSRRLTGTIVVVVEGADAADVARGLAGEGATVVLTGRGGADTGRLLSELEGAGGRPAFFDTDAGAEALVEFLAEQFGFGDHP